MKKLIVIILILGISFTALSADRYMRLKEPYNTINKWLHYGAKEEGTAPATDVILKSIKGLVAFAFEWWEVPYKTETFHSLAKNTKVTPFLEDRLLGISTYENLLTIGGEKDIIEQHIFDHIGDIPLTPYLDLLRQEEYKNVVNIKLGYEHSMIEDFDRGGSYIKGENYIHTIAEKWANDRIKNIMLYITVRPQIMNYVNEKDSRVLKQISSKEVVKILTTALYDYNYMVILEHLYK